MAQANLPGVGTWLPLPVECYLTSRGFGSYGLIDAATEKVAFIGRVWNKDFASKTITKIGFRFGAATKGATTDLRLSLQDVTVPGGFLPTPDGVVDQSFTVPNASILANTWYLGTLDVGRPVAYGDLLSAVLEFSTFNAGDSIVLSSLSTTQPMLATSGMLLHNGTAWQAPAWNSCGRPNIVLGFSDNTWGSMDGAGIFLDVDANPGSVPTTDEIALRMKFPFPLWSDGAIFWGGVLSGASVILRIYNAAMEELKSVTMQSGEIFENDLAWLCFRWSPLKIEPDTVHYLALKPVTQALNAYRQLTVDQAGYWDAFAGGREFYLVSRVGTGAWTEYTTKRPVAALRVVGFDNGAGGAGGLLVHPGMAGGMRG